MILTLVPCGCDHSENVPAKNDAPCVCVTAFGSRPGAASHANHSTWAGVEHVGARSTELSTASFWLNPAFRPGANGRCDFVAARRES
jgi:hypothetical protein